MTWHTDLMCLWSTVSDVIVTWANYLFILLGSLPVWPSKEKIKEHLPDSFKGKYENERGILDCTPKEKLSNSPGQVE